MIGHLRTMEFDCRARYAKGDDIELESVDEFRELLKGEPVVGGL